MASLKELRSRIASVKSTRRITSAMKMVAAAKLRRAQELALAARPYSERMERMLASLAGGASSSPLLAGNGKDETHLLVFVSTDRGLCGGFNINLMRNVRQQVRRLRDAGKEVKIFCIGRKGAALVRREFPSMLVGQVEDISKPVPDYGKAVEIARRLTEMFEAGEFDVCTVVYNRFVSALTQVVTPQQLIPFAAEKDGAASDDMGGASYEYEPSEEDILNDLLPRNLAVQLYRAFLESFASEQGARMTAMDNATRNAGDMIGKLTLNYNRTRQAFITKELIEIISGAEAL